MLKSCIVVIVLCKTEMDVLLNYIAATDGRDGRRMPNTKNAVY